MNDIQRKQITDLRLKGCSYSQISMKVGISENTVKTFCRRNNLKAEDIVTAIRISKGVCECCGSPIIHTEGKRKRGSAPVNVEINGGMQILIRLIKRHIMILYELIVKNRLRLMEIRGENIARMNVMLQIDIMEVMSNG